MRETLHMGDRVADMLRQALVVFEKSDPKLVKEVEKSDNVGRRAARGDQALLVKVSKAEMTDEESQRYVEIITFTTNLEHVGDIIDKNLMELAAKKIKNRYTFSPEGLDEIRHFHGRVMDNMRLAFNVFATRDVAMARRLLAEKAMTRAAELAAADSHFARLREGRPESIETSAIHLDVMRDLKRINGHLTSVAYPILEVAGELRDSRLREREAGAEPVPNGKTVATSVKLLQADQRDPGDDQHRRDDADRPQRLLQEHDRDRGAEQHAGLAQRRHHARSARPSSPRSRSSRRRARARRRSGRSSSSAPSRGSAPVPRITTAIAVMNAPSITNSQSA